MIRIWQTRRRARLGFYRPRPCFHSQRVEVVSSGITVAWWCPECQTTIYALWVNPRLDHQPEDDSTWSAYWDEYHNLS